MKVRVAFIFLALGLCTVIGLGQTAGASAPRTINSTFNISTLQYNTPGITGAPYSADEVTQSIQTLADGSQVVRSTRTDHVYRDSLGRTRTEHQVGAAQGLVMVEIYDPLAGVAYYLDTQNKVAHCVNLPPPPRPSASPVAPAAPPANIVVSQAASKPLGNQVIQGLTATGSQRTVTTQGPAANAQPVARTTETWVSPDLKVTVLLQSSDSRGFQTVVKLTNISRAEPGIGLFSPPTGYTFVNETGPKITFANRSSAP